MRWAMHRQLRTCAGCDAGSIALGICPVAAALRWVVLRLAAGFVEMLKAVRLTMVVTQVLILWLIRMVLFLYRDWLQHTFFVSLSRFRSQQQCRSSRIPLPVLWVRRFLSRRQLCKIYAWKCTRESTGRGLSCIVHSRQQCIYVVA